MAYHAGMGRWSVLVLVCFGCGPTMGIPDPAMTSTNSTDAAQDGGGDDDDDDGADAADPTTTGLPDPGDTGSSSGSSSGDGESSTGAPPFMDGDVIGSWLCTGDGQPFVMHIEGYMSPSQVSGEVCASWNNAVDPMQWGPCATLTLHPIGGGAYLPVYAQVYNPIEGTTWVVDAALLYDTASDTMDGMWAGLGEDEGAISCLRLQ